MRFGRFPEKSESSHCEKDSFYIVRLVKSKLLEVSFRQERLSVFLDIVADYFMQNYFEKLLPLFCCVSRQRGRPNLALNLLP